jgi:hypothetical protein
MFSNEYHLRVMIKQQQQLVERSMADATMNLLTKSKYSTMSRQDQRIAEDYSRRVKVHESLQKDIAKAQTVSSRIGQILGKVRSDLTAIQSFLTTYSFPNTVGSDTNLTADGSKRASWRASLKLLITNMVQFVEAQSLGDYALLHDVDSATTQQLASGGGGSGCACSLVYRPKLHYTTPHSDCLAVPVTMQGFSTGTEDAAPFDSKTTPNTMWHSCVSNPDLQLLNFQKLYADHDYDAWVNELLRVYNKAGTVGINVLYADAVQTDSDNTTDPADPPIDARIEAIRTYMKSVAGLPALFVDQYLDVGVKPNADREEFDPSTVFSIADLDAEIQVLIQTNKEAFDALIISNAPVIDNIEDESDMSYLSQAVHTLLVGLRAYQEANDREQDGLRYVSDTASRNAAHYADQLQEMVHVDESDTTAAFGTLRECAADLVTLVGSVKVSKQGFARKIG